MAAKLGYGRDDWATGRDISSEERECGMILRMREIPTRGASSQPNPTSSSASSSSPLWNAVIKGQSSDFQVNEIHSNELFTAAAILARRPRSRWRKLSRAQTLLVENSPLESFGSPDKTFSPRVQSHGTYMPLHGRLPTAEPVLHFMIYRDSNAVGNLYHRFLRELGVEKAALTLREGPGGFYGCLSQFAAGVGITKEQIVHLSRHYALHPLIIDPRKYYPLEAWGPLTAPPRAYFYRVLLRAVGPNAPNPPPIPEVLQSWTENGFVNYFGIERFGVGANRAFEVAAFAARGDFPRGVGGVLQTLAEADPFHLAHFTAYVNAAPGGVSGVVEAWARETRALRAAPAICRLPDALHRHHAGAKGEGEGGAPNERERAHSSAPERAGEGFAELENAWREGGMEAAARRSAAEFVWNAMASQRLLSHGREVVVGDVVRVGDEAVGDPPAEVRRVRTSEEARARTIDEVVLPVPYPGSDLARAVFPAIGALNFALFEEFAARYQLGFLFHPETEIASIGEKPNWEPITYRPIVRKPHKLSASMIYDPSSFTALKSDLFLLQERKAVEHLDLDYANRVREPSIYNISERFAERLALVKQVHSGNYSVALSFMLPADASPLVALREVFALKYLHFNDLHFSTAAEC
ncbi:unnamed protein product [Phytomonas sp. Hart1]|nr:unnamed protein product [Phytomonas sp. Hart1]|eukprot:CCW68376.1 unnamed protein product [Phytomonas sp. isolate Hart1]